MSHLAMMVQDGARTTGLVLLLILAFLVFALLAVAMRPLLIVAAVVAVAADLVLSRVSPRYRDWFDRIGH